MGGYLSTLTKPSYIWLVFRFFKTLEGGKEKKKINYGSVWYFHLLAQDRRKNISVKYIGEH